MHPRIYILDEKFDRVSFLIKMNVSASTKIHHHEKQKRNIHEGLPHKFI